MEIMMLIKDEWNGHQAGYGHSSGCPAFGCLSGVRNQQAFTGDVSLVFSKKRAVRRCVNNAVAVAYGGRIVV